MSKDLPIFINVSKTMCLINGLFKKKNYSPTLTVY